MATCVHKKRYPCSYDADVFCGKHKCPQRLSYARRVMRRVNGTLVDIYGWSYAKKLKANGATNLVFTKYIAPRAR